MPEMSADVPAFVSNCFCVCELVNMWCFLVFFSAVGERGIPERLPVFRLSFLIALDRVTSNCRYKTGPDGGGVFGF